MNTQGIPARGAAAAPTIDETALRAHLRDHFRVHHRFPAYADLRAAFPAGNGRLVRIRRSIEAELGLPPERRRRGAAETPGPLTAQLTQLVDRLEDLVESAALDSDTITRRLCSIEEKLAQRPATAKPGPSAPIDASVLRPVLKAIEGLAVEQNTLLGEIRSVERTPPAPATEPIQALEASVAALQEELRQQGAARAQVASQADAVLSAQAQAITVITDKVDLVAQRYRDEHKARKEKQVELDAQLFELLHRVGATQDLVTTLSHDLQGRLDEIAAGGAPASQAPGLEALIGSMHAAQKKGFTGLAQSLGRKLRLAATQADETAEAQQQAIEALRDRLPASRSGRALRPADIEALRGLLTDAIKGGSDSVVRRLRTGKGVKGARRGTPVYSSSRPAAAGRRVSAAGATSRRGHG